ncbi:MAG: fibronectin type III domain-containing protein [Pseudomonadota bacterium]
MFTRIRTLSYMCLACLGLIGQPAHAAVEKVRAMFRDDPASSIVIGWNQVSGDSPVVRYGTTDFGTNAAAYSTAASPDRVVDFRGMNNHFVRLSTLESDTPYYFVIEDSEGVSARYWIRTGPADRTDFTYVTGGDTKSGGSAFLAGQESNRMIAKLRPLFAMFTGDFNSDDGTNESFWDDWLNNWSSQTTTEDGRLTPLVAVHGNHENGDYTTINKLFDTPDVSSPYSYYSLDFADGLLHLISLNSELQNGDAPADAFSDQLTWLTNDLAASQSAAFRVAGYHKPLRPHTSSKSEQLFLQESWAPLFDLYSLTMAAESDSHMHKYTFPLSYCEEGTAECFQNFRRDDNAGVFYIGEGSWGAGPRASDDNKPWTIQSQSMNQVKWHRVIADDPETAEEVDPKIEVRTVVTVTLGGEARVEGVESLTEANKYSKIPDGIDLLVLPFFGDHIELPFQTPVGDVPSAPSDLMASPSSFSEIELEWMNTAGADTVSNIEVQMRIGEDGDWSTIGFLPADAASFEAEQLVNDGAHYFRVRALNLFGASDFTPEAVALIPVDTRERVDLIQGYPAGDAGQIYNGAVDVGLLEAAPDLVVDGLSAENPFALMFADNNSGSGDREVALVRFNQLFDFLPEGAVIDQATLTLVSADSTQDIISVHRMLEDWPNPATWSDFGGDGIQLNDVDAGLNADDSRASGIEFLQTIVFDVTESVLAWQESPAANFGWVLVNSGSDGWDTPQSEIPSPLTVPELGVFDVQPRPMLSVFYTLATTTVEGDIDGDGGVDRDDIRMAALGLRQPAEGPDDPRDLDRDGQITVLDLRLIQQLCTNPACAP